MGTLNRSLGNVSLLHKLLELLSRIPSLDRVRLSESTRMSRWRVQLKLELGWADLMGADADLWLWEHIDVAFLRAVLVRILRLCLDKVDHHSVASLVK